MTEQQVHDLIRKYNDGSLSEKERHAMNIWYLQYAASSQYDQIDLSEETEQRLSAQLRSSLPLANQKKRVKLWPRVLAIAATVLILLSVGLWLTTDLFTYNDADTPDYATRDIAPGRTGATLTLANGKRINISEMEEGQLAIESGVKISKTADGQLSYEIEPDASQVEGQMNRLETANGQQIQVKLPDGTIVYLNAASELTYPSSFSKQKIRNVELHGEGYFEVSKDARHPFIVQTREEKIEVLGTQFNINTYPLDGKTITTLVEGSVKVIDESGINSVLKPGQQAISDASHTDVQQVETAYAIAWKNGYFFFNDESLESIMLKLSRWYHTTAVYQDPEVKKKAFFGSISRYEHISKVLNIMERTGVARFDIRDGKIIISNK